MPVIIIEKQTPQITVVTLNRPERRNALTIELLDELIAAIKIASDEPQDRVFILRGAGAAFCTGLDLKEAADPTKAHATAEMVACMARRSPVAQVLCRLAILLSQRKAPGLVIRRCGVVWWPVWS
jgi:enoyl-CoA hydratase/carnithine racemase